MAKFKSFNELSLSQRLVESPSDIEIVKPISNMKRPRFNNSEKSDMRSLTNNSSSEPKMNAFNYLSDGLGGRVKHVNKNDKIMPLPVKLNTLTSSTSLTKKSFLTKFKVSK